MNASTSIYVLCVFLAVTGISALENGLARTPPMGWLSWERFRCNTDCKNDPENCISERLFRTMADLVVSEGYAAAGYEYINVDDCWLEKERGEAGQLVPDRERFSRGIKDLSDYNPNNKIDLKVNARMFQGRTVRWQSRWLFHNTKMYSVGESKMKQSLGFLYKNVHSKGLKFGIYEDLGNYTCAGYPGITNPYMESDALTFSSWGVDYVKLDGCYSLPRDMDRGYPEFGFYLNRTGRPMVYSCSWPVYQIYAGINPNFKSIIDSCNLWRNFDDIQDSWQSLESIIDYYGNNQDSIIPNAGPGHFNDPDMLIIGNFGLSYEQSKTQMAMWAILAAPLLMSVDLRTIRPEYKAILQNRKIIGVDQDPLGIQGRRIYKHRGIEIWARPITPLHQSYFSYAIAFLNRRTDGTPSDIAVTLRELGLGSPTGYHVEDLYEDVSYGILNPSTKIKVKVNPSGVVILRADVQSARPPPQRFAPLPTVDDNRITYTPYVPQSTARTPTQRQDPGFVATRQPLSDFLPRARAPLLQPLPSADADYQPGQSTARPPPLRQEYILRQDNQIPIQRRDNVPQPPPEFVPIQRDANFLQQPSTRIPITSRASVDPFQAYRVQQF